MTHLAEFNFQSLGKLLVYKTKPWPFGLKVSSDLIIVNILTIKDNSSFVGNKIGQVMSSSELHNNFGFL